VSLALLLGAVGATGWITGQFWMTVVLAALLVAVVLLISGTGKDSVALPMQPAPKRKAQSLSRGRRLARQMRGLRDAAVALPDGVVLLDRAGRVRWINHAAERLLGVRHLQNHGLVLAERLASSEINNWLQGNHAAPLNEVAAPNDPLCHLSLAMIPVGREQRLLFVRDISTLMRLEQVRRDFVANVSHELRTPLTVIHGYLELLEPEEVPSLAPVLGEMRAQSRRMGQIVEDLLTLSRLEVQESAIEELVSLSPLLATLRQEAEALSQGRHEIAFHDDAHCDLQGSPKDLHSAFSNLVSNAVRYTPAGGRIEVRWHREADGGARLAVTDTGYGIPVQHLPRLTERFYRVSSSRSRETGGTGLGLSIVKHVLALHHARLEVTSEPGRGSTFACVFGPERLLEPESDC
jgi:two-component system phosphate regulon sensor histidine kinase PhoR